MLTLKILSGGNPKGIGVVLRKEQRLDTLGSKSGTNIWYLWPSLYILTSLPDNIPVCDMEILASTS